jgi:hypothetical protein
MTQRNTNPASEQIINGVSIEVTCKAFTQTLLDRHAPLLGRTNMFIEVLEHVRRFKDEIQTYHPEVSDREAAGAWLVMMKVLRDLNEEETIHLSNVLQFYLENNQLGATPKRQTLKGLLT